MVEARVPAAVTTACWLAELLGSASRVIRLDWRLPTWSGIVSLLPESELVEPCSTEMVASPLLVVVSPETVAFWL